MGNDAVAIVLMVIGFIITFMVPIFFLSTMF